MECGAWSMSLGHAPESQFLPPMPMPMPLPPPLKVSGLAICDRWSAFDRQQIESHCRGIMKPGNRQLTAFPLRVSVRPNESRPSKVNSDPYSDTITMAWRHWLWQLQLPFEPTMPIRISANVHLCGFKLAMHRVAIASCNLHTSIYSSARSLGINDYFRLEMGMELWPS